MSIEEEDLKLKNLHKELDIIQDIIKRMANNSFIIKGWSLSLFAGMLVFTYNLFTKEKASLLILSFIVPIILFWFLDSYYLRQERLFRELYKWVIDNRVRDDFNNLFSMDTEIFKKKVQNIMRIAFSISEWPIYAIMIFIIVLIYIFLVLN